MENVVLNIENIEEEQPQMVWHQALQQDLESSDPEDYNYRPSHTELRIPEGIDIPIPQFYIQFGNLLKGSLFF